MFILRSVSDLTAWVVKTVPQYILRSVPAGIPLAAKYFSAYAQSLLTSRSIYGALFELDRQTAMDPVPSPVINLETGEVSEDSFMPSLDFMLRDYCSVVGVSYKPEYKEAILRCLVRKDFEFFRWLFSTYLGAEIQGLEELHGGTFVDGVYTTDTPQTAYEDSGLFTDMVVRSMSVLVITFNEGDKDSIYKKWEDYWDLFYLVLPARLPVVFKWV